MPAAMIPEEVRRDLLKAAHRSTAKHVTMSTVSGMYSAIRIRDGWEIIEGGPQKKPVPSAAIAEDRGPGTELKRILALMGIHADEGCACNAMAAKMNANGPKWCLENIGEIVDVMEAEAKRRKLPLSDAPGFRLSCRVAVRTTVMLSQHSPFLPSKT